MGELNLYHLKTFYTVARHLNYSRAGEELAISQPAVSRQVAALEKSLCMDLFVQRGRQVELTDAGRSLFDYADRIFHLVNRAERTLAEYKDLERGQVFFGAGITIGCWLIPQIMKSFQQMHPHIEVSLLLANSSTIERMVTCGDLDLGFTAGSIMNPALHMESIFREELVLVISSQHPLVRPNITAAELKGETLLWREKGSAARDLVEQYLEEEGLTFKNRAEVSDSGAIKQLVIDQMGAAFLPHHAVEQELKSGVLYRVEYGNSIIELNCHIVSVKDMHSYPAVLAFLNYVRKWASEHKITCRKGK
ncbi:DNA-binding transcriptional regulator, LysR family [Desulfotomaculum arcticum]|uniref:DNA-binding transcriptional regulator, LysR family n=1 Tax=Desulfotruncus arcticus DSM 17038 TaxID=1121424 RepID=A0A1I2URF8_9FIRM|nr:LysR family transcriptional regulator [Desulfotruncus arcticus]SFG77341.1 DNA-binding transcriptional regulator, LysR family [Desulfotomaculum arcticum] [Desulfotruncus arcticus DSM 17038]